jgi:hypothetical protein
LRTAVRHDQAVASDDLRFDALLPAEMAAQAERVGVRKANLDAVRACRSVP